VHLLGADRPQLRRDLRWWVPRDLKKTIVVRESPEGSLVVKKALVVGCGRATPTKVKLERIQLDEDDNGPPYGQAVENGFLAMESFRPPASLYVLDLFSSFMKAVVIAMDKPIDGLGEVRPNDAGILGSWTSFTLHNTLLSKMAGDIETTGLATLSEVYSTIIPPLSIEDKLPLVDNIVELAREHARPHEERNNMKKATEVYIWLIKTARLFPNDTSFVARSTAVILDHRDQLIKSTELSDRLKPIALPPPGIFETVIETPKETSLQQQIEDELQLGEPESRNLLVRLMLLYDDQCRLHILPSQFVRIAAQDPTFLRLRGHTKHSPSREYEDGTEQRDITGWTELHREAARGNAYSLACLLDSDVDPDIRDLLGQTALHLACQAGNMKTVTTLVRYGADMNARTRNGSAPLHYAARRGDLWIVELIVESGAEFDAMDSARMTPAMWAALEGRKDVLSYLWKNSNLNLRDIGGRAVLHHAVLSGCCGVVDIFEDGVDTEVRDHEGRTPLHLAALYGNDDALLTLHTKLQANMGALDHSWRHLLHLAAVGGQMKMMDQLVKTFNADVICTDKSHETPLHLIVREGKDTIIEALVKLEANLEARNDMGETPLMTACILGRIKSVQQLIKFGANINTATDLGDSALDMAARNGHKKVVEYLLKAGADKDKKGQSGLTVLHSATTCGGGKIVQLLIDAGVEKEKRDNQGRTPLHIAVGGGRSAVTKILLISGADKGAKDNDGMTPLHYAAGSITPWYWTGLKRGKSGTVRKQTRDVVELGQERIVKLLLKAGAEKQTVNKEGKTARQLAEEKGNQRVVEILDMF
jgi:ankyrin repeat protein